MRATLFVSLVSLTALFVPLELVVSIISFGALAAFTMVNLAVVKTHAIDERRRTGRDLNREINVDANAFGRSSGDGRRRARDVRTLIVHTTL